MGKLTITRTNQYVNRIRKIQLYLDGSKFYKISYNETKAFEIPDGEHLLYAKIDWIKTKPVTLTIEQGKEKQVELGSPVTYNNKQQLFSSSSFLILLLCIFLSKRLHNDLICIIPAIALIAISIYFYFFSKNKSALYYLIIKPRDLFYLKEV